MKLYFFENQNQYKNIFFQSFCMCPTGMKLDIDWKTCIAQNGNSGIMEEKIECQTGYVLDHQINQCIDIDECKK